MKTVIGLLILSILCMKPTMAFAHGGGGHFMGTVKVIDAKGITIVTKDNKEVKITFDDKTKFEMSGATATAKDVTVGERVVVHTAKQTSAHELKAVLVKFSAKTADTAHPHEDTHGQDH